MLDELERALGLREDFWQLVLRCVGVAFAALLLGSAVARAALAALCR